VINARVSLERAQFSLIDNWRIIMIDWAVTCGVFKRKLLRGNSKGSKWPNNWRDFKLIVKCVAVRLLGNRARHFTSNVFKMREYS
jgi:hypothetical protein